MHTKTEAAWYLAAMIDGEGSVSNTKRGKYAHGYHRGVKIANTDLDLIKATGRACDLLGVAYSIRTVEETRNPAWKPCHYLVIYGRENLIKLLDVPIQSRGKREKLVESVKTYVYLPVDDTKLREMYESGLSSVQIHKTTGHSKSTVLRALHRSGTLMRGGR